MRRRDWLLLIFALLGLVATHLAVTRWVPDVGIALPSRADIVARALEDAERLDYRVVSRPALQLSAGPRLLVPMKPYDTLVRTEPSRAARQRLIAAAAPVRMAARFPTAIGSNGSTGDLVLEYDGEAELAGASFGMDALAARTLPLPEGARFADRIAGLLLGGPPPARENTGPGGTRENVYRPRADVPGVYVFLRDDGAWTAQLQPTPDLLASSQTLTIWQMPVIDQVVLYCQGALAALAVGMLLWRLARRRAGLPQAMVPAVLLGIGLMPILGDFQVAPAVLFALALLYLLPQVGVLLVWVVGEAELREARPGSLEHWDRLLRAHPVKATGGRLLIGLGFGCVLSGLIATSGRLAEALGGGYGAFLLTLPDYWLLPTALNRGLALAAGTAFAVGFGGRLGGHAGAIAGGAASGLFWAPLLPVSSLVPSLAFGILAALAAGWAVWWHGLLTLAVTCVTGLSLPVAFIAWRIFPHNIGTTLVTSIPFLLLPAGLILLARAPRRRAATIEPGWVVEREHDERLEGEIQTLRDLQLSLLPPPSLADTLGIDVAWHMNPAAEVGGDFCDLIRDEDGRLWIAVADAAGHGISCSVLTAFTKAAFTEHATPGVDPAAAMARIRRLFGRLGSTRTLVTLLLAMWDPKERRLTVAAAGHPPLLLWDGARVHELGLPSRPLGVELPGEDLQQSVACSGPAVLVAFTDGVGEATSPSDEAYGYERWKELLPEVAQRPSEELLAHLLAEVDRHRRGRSAEDDVTALVVHCE